jgi:hypothetical protein
MDTLFALAALQPRQLPVSPVLKQRKEELAALLPDWEKAQASGLFAENFFLDNRVEALEKETNAAFAKAGKIIKIHDLQP